MLIAGANRFAKQLLDVIFQLNLTDGLAFYDDYDPELSYLYDFPVLKSATDAKDYFLKNGNSFALGTGNPETRKILKNLLERSGGNCVSLISPMARVAKYAEIGQGSCILTGGVVENDSILGEGVLLNLNALVCHDCKIGDFVEISPGAVLTGECQVEDYSFIGAGAILRPKVKIGKNVVIGAGAVVTKDIEDNSLAIGVPAVVIKKREPLVFPDKNA